MIGNQFRLVGGTAKDLVTVGELDSSMSGFDGEGTFKTTMRVWTGNGYTIYGWSGGSGTEYLEDATMDNKWLNEDLELVDDVADAGFGFWIEAGETGTITISGEVPSESSIETPLVAGFNLLANPYPGAVAIPNFGQLDSSFAGFDGEGTFATTMRVWTGNGYTIYGWSGTSGSEYLEDSTMDNKWLNEDLELVEETIPFGTAVWIEAPASGKITFSAPAAN